MLGSRERFLGKMEAFQKTWKRGSFNLEQNVRKRNVRGCWLEQYVEGKTAKNMRNLWCTKEGWEEKTLSASMEENHSSEILWVLYTWVFLSKTHGFSAFKPRHVSQRSVPLLPQLHPQPTRCLGLSVHPMKIDFLLFPTLNLLLLRFFCIALLFWCCKIL